MSTEKERKIIERRFIALAAEMRHVLPERLEEVIRKYRQDRVPFDEARKKKKKKDKPGGILMPRVMAPSGKGPARAKTFRVYWQVLIPLPAGVQGQGGKRYTSKHLPKGRSGGRKYSKALFEPYCLPEELELVLSVEQELAEIQKLIDAVHSIVSAVSR